MNPLAFVLSRILLPLACGALGGVLAMSLARQPASESEACARLSEQVSSLQVQVKELGSAAPPAALAVVSPQVNEEARRVAEDLRARAQTMKEQFDATRAKVDQRRDDRVKESSEVELVKLRNLQKTLTLEQTNENVARRLKRLGLTDADVTTVSAIGAPYIRERSDALIKVLERTSTGTKVSRAEVEAQLKPLDDLMANSIPTTLDEVTRRAVATELRSMVLVPYFFRD